MAETKKSVLFRSYFIMATRMVSAVSVLALACQLLRDAEKRETIKIYTGICFAVGLLLNAISVTIESHATQLCVSRTQGTSCSRKEAGQLSYPLIVCSVSLPVAMPVALYMGGTSGFFVALISY